MFIFYDVFFGSGKELGMSNFAATWLFMGVELVGELLIAISLYNVIP